MFADDTLAKDGYRGLQEKLLCLLFLWISRFNNLAFATFFFFLICTPTSKSCLEDNDRVPLREVQAVFPNLQVDSQDATAANQTSWFGGGWYGLGGAWKTMVDFLWQPSKQFFQILTVKYQDAATVNFTVWKVKLGSKLEFSKLEVVPGGGWNGLGGGSKTMIDSHSPAHPALYCPPLCHQKQCTDALCTIHCAKCTDAQCTVHNTLSTMNPARCTDAQCTDALMHDSRYTPLRPETMHSAH